MKAENEFEKIYHLPIGDAVSAMMSDGKGGLRERPIAFLSVVSCLFVYIYLSNRQ